MSPQLDDTLDDTLADAHRDASAATDDGHGADDRNLVHLRGRVTGAPAHRTLPSGDEVVGFGLTVTRPDGGVDTLPIQVGPAPPAGQRPRAGQVGRRLLGVAVRAQVGDVLEVEGCLRRRWWEAQGRRVSRIEVVAHRLEVVAR